MAYATLAALKAVLTVPPLPDAAYDAEWQQMLDVGAAAIDRYCRRTFAPLLTASPILLDAPAAIDLPVPDVLGQVTLSAYGAPLTADTDYRLLTADVRAPYRLTTWEPHYTRIRRLAAGRPVTWQSFSAGAAPDQAIVLTFLEGYSTVVPGDVVLSNVRIAARLWGARLEHYADQRAAPGGGAVAVALGLIEGDPGTLDLLWPLRREDT